MEQKPWISVKQIQPPEDQLVLCYAARTQAYMVGYIKEGFFGTYIAKGGKATMLEVTHWQELTKPYNC